MPKVRCKKCMDIVERDSAIKMGLSYFCSDEHRREYVYSRPKPTAKPGPDQATREFVLKRDNYCCSLCNIEYTLHIHHVRYRSEGGGHTADNLLTLCRKCHELVHSDKDQYQPLCLYIIETREKD